MSDCDLLADARHAEDDGEGKPTTDRASRVSQYFPVGQASEGSTSVKTDDSVDLESGESNWGPDKKRDV